jgi:hypothetical protein
MRKAGNVLVPSVFRWASPRANRQALAAVMRSKARSTEGRVFGPAIKGQQPIEIGAAAAGIGHLNQLRTSTARCARSRCWSTTTARPCRRWRCWPPQQPESGPADIKLNVGDSVQIGKLQGQDRRVRALMLPQFYKGKRRQAGVCRGFVSMTCSAARSRRPNTPTRSSHRRHRRRRGRAVSDTRLCRPVAGRDDRAHHVEHPERAFHRAAGLGRLGLLGVFPADGRLPVAVLPRLSAGTAAIVTLVLFVACWGRVRPAVGRSPPVAQAGVSRHPCWPSATWR